MSAYAIDALYFARAGHIGVDPGILARGRSFVAGMLANPGRFGWCATDPVCKARMRFEALWALAQGGDRRTDFLTDIVAQSDGFDSATKIRLARYLLQTAGWQHQGIAMAANQMQTLYSTGRYAVANVTTRWGWQGSQVDAQAQTLKLMLEIHAPKPQLDAAVRALVAQPCRCGWDTPNNTATALTALVVYTHDQPIVPTTVVVSVGEIPIGKASFGKTAGTRTFTAQGAQLKGPMIGIEATDGTVHYTAVYTYPVAADAPGQLAAFRVERRR